MVQFGLVVDAYAERTNCMQVIGRLSPAGIGTEKQLVRSVELHEHDGFWPLARVVDFCDVVS